MLVRSPDGERAIAGKADIGAAQGAIRAERERQAPAAGKPATGLALAYDALAMRPDFQCGICQQLVPEFYYGGSCALCGRIRCNDCMRTCPLCRAELCPDCLGEPGADGACGHRPLPPPYRMPGKYQPPPWPLRPTPVPAPPLATLPEPGPVATAFPGRAAPWWLMAAAALLAVPVYGLLEFMLSGFATTVAIALVAAFGSAELPSAVRHLALPLALVIALAVLAARAQPLLEVAAPPAVAVAIALALETWAAPQLPLLAIGLPLAAVLAGLGIGGTLGSMFSGSWSWRRAGGGALLGALVAASGQTRIDDIAGLAFIVLHLATLILLPLALRRRAENR